MNMPRRSARRRPAAVTSFAVLLVALLGLFAAGLASAQDNGPTTGTDIIRALTAGDVYVVPGLRNQVDTDAIQQAATAARPTVVKIAVLGATGRYPNRAALADDLRKHLNLGDDAVVLVATQHGVGGSSGRLSASQIDQTLQTAGLDQAFAQGGLTQAVVTATRAMSGTVVGDRRTDTARGSGTLILLFGGLAAFVVIMAGRRGRAMKAAREPLEALRRQALDNFGYVDGYLDLLPKGPDADEARRRRAQAYEAYSTANGVLQTAKAPDEVRRAEPLLHQAIDELNRCRVAIDKATGGTGVAMGLPPAPSLATDEEKARAYLALKPVEAIQTESERDHLQREIDAIPDRERGVSFFSGRPVPASQLVPVNMVVGGTKRTVMATREEAEAIARGETPRVRAFDDGSGRYLPWYEYRGYDPYRDYYGGWGYGGGLGTLVDLYVLTNVLGPGMWGGYGPWGFGGFGWGMPMPPVVASGDWYYSGDNNGAYGSGGGGFDTGANAGGFDFFGNPADANAIPDNAGSFDFFGQQGYNEQDPGGGFDVASPDTGDSGGFDLGGGDSGGGFDAGSFDSGGGFGGDS